MTQSITIASGKGGVGKTCISVNLSIKLAQLGRKVSLLDADFGLANSHILMGCNAKKTLSDVVAGKNSIEDVIEKTSSGVQLLAGGSGLLDMLNLDNKARYQLIRNVEVLRGSTDVLIVDAPAGASDSAITFAAAADRVLVAIVGEPTSFMDGYAFIKAAHVETGLSKFSIVVNMARDGAEAKRHFDKFQSIALRFLDVELTYVGHVPFSTALRRSIVARKPLLATRSEGHRLEDEAFTTIARNLLAAPVNTGNGLRFFDGNLPAEQG